MPKLTKYGWIKGGSVGFSTTVTTNQLIRAASGKFVKRPDANSDLATLATATDTELLGHLECEELNSSKGTEVRKVISDPSAVYRIPVIHGTYSAKMKGKQCDLTTSAGIQGAELASCVTGVLLIVGGDEVDGNWVDVMVSPRTKLTGNLVA